MTEREAPVDIVLEIARIVRIPEEKKMEYLSRMNVAVWAQIAAYQAIVNKTGEEVVLMEKDLRVGER
jgi:hypothetical protein